MKLVLQRVTEASVTVNGEVVGSIGRGVMALVGLAEDDSEADADWAVTRISKTALWPEHLDADDPAAEGKPWQHSVVSARLDVLCVSQFTLCASLKKVKKNRGAVTFHRALSADRAKLLYSTFLAKLAAQLPEGSTLADGEFGARMKVAIVNDGPVTLTLDSRHGNGLAPIVSPVPPSESAEQNAGGSTGASSSEPPTPSPHAASAGPDCPPNPPPEGTATT